MSISANDVTAPSQAVAGGSRGTLEDLSEEIYRELHKLAERAMKGERRNHTLQPTALVNEAYLRLVDQKSVCFQSRGHFYAMATKVMRRILIDHARSKNARKRGGDLIKVSLGKVDHAKTEDQDFTALEDELQFLEKIAPRQAIILELRFYGGLSIEEIATVVNRAPRTIFKELKMAKGWLFERLEKGP